MEAFIPIYKRIDRTPSVGMGIRQKTSEPPRSPVLEASRIKNIGLEDKQGLHGQRRWACSRRPRASLEALAMSGREPTSPSLRQNATRSAPLRTESAEGQADASKRTA